MKHVIQNKASWQALKNISLDQCGFWFLRSASDVKAQLKQRALCLHRQPGMSSAQSPDRRRVGWPGLHLKKLVLTIWVIEICFQDRVEG